MTPQYLLDRKEAINSLSRMGIDITRLVELDDRAIINGCAALEMLAEAEPDFVVAVFGGADE